MYRKKRGYIESSQIPIAKMNEKSRTFVWDFPKQAADYRELTAGRTLSEYSQLSGNVSPLYRRNLFTEVNSPPSDDVADKRWQGTVFDGNLPSHDYGTLSDSIAYPVTVGIRPDDEPFRSNYTRYENVSSPYNRVRLLNLDTSWERAFLPQTVNGKGGMSAYFGTVDGATARQHAAVNTDDIPDFGYYYDMRSNTWKRDAPPFYLTDRKYLTPEDWVRKDLSVYARIFKNYLTDNGETGFAEVPVPYKDDGEADFTEALLPNDLHACAFARNLWQLYMYKKAPEAYEALEYAKSRGEDTAWVSQPYLKQHGVQPLRPYVWKKELYNRAMQGEDFEQLWSDLTGLKEFKWDMPSLFDKWIHSGRKYEPFWAKETEESQKSITFDDVTKQVNKLCLEDKDNLFLMVPLDSINKAWFTQSTGTSCFKTCQNIAANLGQAKTGNSERIIPFTYQRDQTGAHYYYGDRKENYKKVISVIDRHLLNKRAVIMGLDYKFDGINLDGTDHFVLLMGKGYDPERKQYYYLYADPGRKTLQGGVSLEENRIYLDDKRCILSGKKTGKTNKDWSNNYVLTHVCPNDGKDGETESVANIYSVLSKQSHEDKQPFSYENGDTMFIRNYDPDNLYNELSE